MPKRCEYIGCAKNAIYNLLENNNGPIYCIMFLKFSLLDFQTKLQ